MIAHISLGTFIILVVAGITYGIVITIKDLFPRAAPVHPKHTNFTHGNQTMEHVMEFYTVGNKTVGSEILKKSFYNQKCWCGEGHACNIVDGKKLCFCQEGFAANNGKCEKCDCGANYESCEFQNGKKECECHEGYASNNGICQECFCGKDSTCLFEDGEKMCFCPEDQQQSNGTCIVWMCLDDTCHRGTCEVNENGFFCNCEDGYSGHRCDEEAFLSQGAIYLISVLSALTLFWVILLLVYIIRKRNRYRHYHNEKLDATMNVLSEENPDSAM